MAVAPPPQDLVGERRGSARVSLTFNGSKSSYCERLLNFKPLIPSTLDPRWRASAPDPKGPEAPDGQAFERAEEGGVALAPPPQDLRVWGLVGS